MKFFFLFSLLFFSHIFGASACCEVYFSPQESLGDRLIALMAAEKKSIKVAMHSLTHLGIAKALEQARHRGVSIEVLVDPSCIKTRSSLQRLIQSKVPIFVWDRYLCLGKGKEKRRMHDTFCIFGNHTVWTGSFDFTNNGNQENAVSIQSEEVAAKYLAQFSQMKLYESRPYQEYLMLYPKKKREKKGQNGYSSAVGG